MYFSMKQPGNALPSSLSVQLAVVAWRVIAILLLAGCGDNSASTKVTSPAPWMDQLTAAQQTAKQVSMQATLIRVSAYPVPSAPASSGVITGPLLVDFLYSLPDLGQEMTIQLQDVEPKSSVHVISSYVGSTEEIT